MKPNQLRAEAALQAAEAQFPRRVSRAMAQAIAASGGAGGPVAAQFLPDPREAVIRPEERADPIGDAEHAPVPGLTHRYPDRAILHLTLTCDVHCRFCFRREVVGEAGPLPADRLDAALDYIARTPALREIILTGGDPLTLSPRRVAAVLDRLDAMPQLEGIRIHSRVPVVAPGRIDDAMLAALGGRRATLWLVVHVNHGAELTPDSDRALARLADAGLPLAAQTVMLRGVNADAATLETLCRALLRRRVRPYYLHHPDLARGTSHFRMSLDEGRAIAAELSRRVSGLAMPRHVIDLPGGYGKVALVEDNLRAAGPGRWSIRDRTGRWHDYHDVVG